MAPFFSDILIERELEKGSRSEKLMIGVTGGTVAGVVGGAAVGGRAGHGALPRRKFAVYWDGDSLVFENRSSVGEPPATLVWTERREVWSLDSAGFVRVGITTRNSVGPPTTLSLTYRRRTANDHGP